MEKLKLSLDTLSVQSFQPDGGAPQGRGTVQAAEAAPSMFDHTACSCPYTCPKPY
ncbi:MAG TPA: hypothetical protein VGB15_21245 [Longimicrobium sp.]|jgi:hypothetical protein